MLDSVASNTGESVAATDRVLGTIVQDFAGVYYICTLVDPSGRRQWFPLKQKTDSLAIQVSSLLAAPVGFDRHTQTYAENRGSGPYEDGWYHWHVERQQWEKTLPLRIFSRNQDTGELEVREHKTVPELLERIERHEKALQILLAAFLSEGAIGSGSKEDILRELGDFLTKDAKVGP